MLTASAIAALKQSLRGALLGPADGEYDAARKVWNGMIDKRPALIARCARAADDPKDDDRMIRWARNCWEAMKPFADGAVYVNALDDALEAGERPVREAYGANYERLRELKKKYDPTNLFRQNSNIKPS